jgi:hypothetical protein
MPSVHTVNFPTDAESLCEGISRRCGYAKKMVVKTLFRKGRLVESSDLVKAMWPGSQSFSFIGDDFINDEEDLLEGEFPIAVKYEVDGVYEKGAPFHFSIESDGLDIPPNIKLSFRGCDAYITYENAVFEDKKFVRGVSNSLLEAIVDTCGGREY